MMSVLSLVPEDAEKRFTSRLGMYIVLASISMLFFTMFVMHTIIKTRMGGYLGVETGGKPFNIATFNTIIMALSSYAYWWAFRQTPGRDARRMRRGLTLTIVLGLTFLAMQLKLWQVFVGRNVLPSTEMFGAVFFMMTGLHGLHLIAALTLLGWISIQYYRDRLTLAAIDAGGLLWHFLGALWLGMYIVIFIL